MNIEYQIKDLPRLENIILPIDQDQYIKSFEEIAELINPDLRYVEMTFGDIRLKSSLALPVDLSDILIGLDDLADNISDHSRHAIQNFSIDDKTIVFELD
jgi:hypothetical protein